MLLKISKCERTPPCVSEVLYPADDAYVQQELDVRLSDSRRSHKNVPYNASSLMLGYKELGLRWGETEVPIRHADSPWMALLTNAQKATLTFTHGDRPLRTSGHEPDAGSALLRDISQSFFRVRYSKSLAAYGHVAFTQCSDQLV